MSKESIAGLLILGTIVIIMGLSIFISEQKIKKEGGKSEWIWEEININKNK